MPLLASASSVNEEQLFHRLDSYIAQRSKFTQRKEAKLLRLKKQLYTTSDKHNQLRLYNQIYREYYTYRYGLCHDIRQERLPAGCTTSG
ncbi:hypothetical protein [Segatella copri]|uniref:hypothetical protein n=1 Tax=Segatella copri TaxID=165179 RepID=UPI003F8C4B1F